VMLPLLPSARPTHTAPLHPKIAFTPAQ
jgi:hypothetical protein